MSTATFLTGKISSIEVNPPSDESLEQILEIAIRDQKERWQRGERTPAEAYVAHYPVLADPHLRRSDLRRSPAPRIVRR